MRKIISFATLMIMAALILSCPTEQGYPTTGTRRSQARLANFLLKARPQWVADRNKYNEIEIT